MQGRGNRSAFARIPHSIKKPCPERFRPASRLNSEANARAALPSDRRYSGQCFPHPRDGRGRGFRVRHVRHRRRVSDDAAVDLRRHRARGRGRLRRQPHRGLVILRRHLLLAPPRHRSGAGAGALERRHCRHRARRLDIHAVARARPARPHDCAVLRRAALDRGRADVLGGAARYSARTPRRRGADAPLGQPRLDPRTAAEDALQALQDLSVGDSDRCRRRNYRLHRRGDGHRRRLYPDPDHDLSPAGADLDRDRHFDGADAGHHGVRHHAARGHQPSGRRRAGADPDGRRRDGCAVRRPCRPEDPRRTFTPAAGPADSRGRNPLRHRARDPPRRALHHPGNRRRRMIARPAFAVGLVLAVGIAASPARAERLIVSVSNHRVTVTPNYSGEELVLFGSVEKDASTPAGRTSYDLVVTVSGPRADMVTRRKERKFGIWVNTDYRQVLQVPTYLALFSNRPFEAIATPEVQRRQQLGLNNVLLTQRVGPDYADVVPNDPFRSAFVRLRSEHGLYREATSAVTFLTPTLFRTGIPLPGEVPIGTYDVEIKLFAEGALVTKTDTAFEIVKVGFEQFVANTARQNGLIYGLVTACMALMTGWIASIVFRKD